MRLGGKRMRIIRRMQGDPYRARAVGAAPSVSHSTTQAAQEVCQPPAACPATAARPRPAAQPEPCTSVHSSGWTSRTAALAAACARGGRPHAQNRRVRAPAATPAPLLPLPRRRGLPSPPPPRPPAAFC
jgi:hypothetical protein